MTVDREKINYLTRIISEMGGFPALFAGFCILILQVLDISLYLGYLEKDTHLKLWFGTLFLAIITFLLAYKKVVQYFQAKYGLVQRTAVVRREKFSYFFAFLFYLVGTSAGSHLDVRVNLPFSITFLMMSGFIAGVWFVRYRGVSNIILYAAIACLILSFAPWKIFYSMLNLTEGRTTAVDFYELIASTIYALTFIISGLLDYYLLTTNLKPASIAETEEIYESV